MSVLLNLTSLTIILLSSLITSLIAKKIRISNALLLIIVGFFLKKYLYLSQELIISIALFSLAIIIFEGSSHLKYGEFNRFSIKAMENIIIILISSFIVTIISIAYYQGKNVLTLNIKEILNALIIATILVSTDATTIFSMLGKKIEKGLIYLKVESIINTPITIIIPFLFLNIPFNNINLNIIIKTFFLQVINGLGTGVLIGLIILKIMKKWYSKELSSIAIITAALLSYVIAENLGGNGVLAVASLGLLFGNSSLKEKNRLEEFNGIISFGLEIIIFTILGTLLNTNYDLKFWLLSITLFIATIIIRFIIIKKNNINFNNKEIFFIASNIPKGIATATVLILLKNYLITNPYLKLAIDISTIIIIYSLIISSIVNRFAKKIINVKIS